MTRRASNGIGIVGSLLTATAIVWWALVYYQVSINTDLTLPATVPCLFYTSDLCSLAMSLCGGKHILNITRYSSNLLWAGVAVVGLGFLINTFVRRTESS